MHATPYYILFHRSTMGIMFNTYPHLPANILFMVLLTPYYGRSGPDASHQLRFQSCVSPDVLLHAFSIGHAPYQSFIPLKQ